MKFDFGFEIEITQAFKDSCSNILLDKILNAYYFRSLIKKKHLTKSKNHANKLTFYFDYISSSCRVKFFPLTPC
ncbi:MAG: hypothetical protein HGGPFJEG_01018 [Ignavibacteria bacterium]|nr:hypothetical protein [Ignavibacteria bacterium]